MKFTIGGESHEIKMASWQRSNVSPSMELTVERTMTTEAKALALLNAVRTERGFAPVVKLYGSVLLGEALCRAIEQHEAFRQEVSDAVVHCRACSDPEAWTRIKFELERLINPKPKPDPLVEVLHEVDTGPEWDSPEDYCNKIRAALDAAGFEIREKNDDRRQFPQTCIK